MIISFCSQLFDYSGDHLLEPDMNKSDFSVAARRVSRSATLDGGALIVDNGYTPSDATFVIHLPSISMEQRDAIISTVKTHSAIIVSCKAGCFLGVVERVDESSGLKIRFLVKSDLTQ